MKNISYHTTYAHLVRMVLIAVFSCLWIANASSLDLYRHLRQVIGVTEHAIHKKHNDFTKLAAQKIVIKTINGYDAGSLEDQLNSGQTLNIGDIKYTFYLPETEEKCSYYTLREPGMFTCGLGPICEVVFLKQCSAFEDYEKKRYSTLPSSTKLSFAGLNIMQNIIDIFDLTQKLNDAVEKQDSSSIYHFQDTLSNFYPLETLSQPQQVDVVIKYFATRDPQAITALTVEYLVNEDWDYILTIQGERDYCKVEADYNGNFHEITCKAM